MDDHDYYPSNSGDGDGMFTSMYLTYPGEIRRAPPSHDPFLAPAR